LLHSFFTEILYLIKANFVKKGNRNKALIQLDFIDLGWSLGIVAIAAILSSWQRLGLEGQIIYAAGRSLLQLLVVGYIIAIIFALNNPLAVLANFGRDVNHCRDRCSQSHWQEDKRDVTRCLGVFIC
jgi:Uncharacterised protein family (UPF0014)